MALVVALLAARWARDVGLYKSPEYLLLGLFVERRCRKRMSSVWFLATSLIGVPVILKCRKDLSTILVPIVVSIIVVSIIVVLKPVRCCLSLTTCFYCVFTAVFYYLLSIKLSRTIVIIYLFI